MEAGHWLQCQIQRDTAWSVSWTCLMAFLEAGGLQPDFITSHTVEQAMEPLHCAPTLLMALLAKLFITDLHQYSFHIITSILAKSQNMPVF